MIFQSLFDTMEKINSFSFPVPDVVLVLLGVAIIAAMNIRATGRQKKATDTVVDAYTTELARLNQLKQSAEAKLARTKSDLERERRRSRHPR